MNDVDDTKGGVIWRPVFVINRELDRSYSGLLELGQPTCVLLMVTRL